MSTSQPTPPALHTVRPGEGSAALSPEKARERAGKRRLLAVGAGFVLALGGYFGYRVLGAGEETTDDATVEAEIVPVSARVAGQVLSVRVEDNARVKRGDVLVEIDPTEAKARAEQAEGELQAAEAQAAAADAQEQISAAGARGGLATSRAQVGSAEAQVNAARAQLARAQAEARKSEGDLARAKTLAEASAMSQAGLDAAQAASDAAQAGLQAATAQLAAAQNRVAEASGTLDVNAPIDAKIAAAKSAARLAHARVTTARAALDLARLSLSYTTVVAPQDGTVARLSLRPSQLVAPGQMMAQLVPDKTFVVANFKETQVGKMRPGQPVEVELDTYPGLKLPGVVDSITPGTGSRFSLLAPDNASGNFVKVVQRVPVRIRWESAPQVTLRPGMSAVARVHVGG